MRDQTCAAWACADAAPRAAVADGAAARQNASRRPAAAAAEWRGRGGPRAPIGRTSQWGLQLPTPQRTTSRPCSTTDRDSGQLFDESLSCQVTMQFGWTELNPSSVGATGPRRGRCRVHRSRVLCSGPSVPLGRVRIRHTPWYSNPSYPFHDVALQVSWRRLAPGAICCPPFPIAHPRVYRRCCRGRCRRHCRRRRRRPPDAAPRGRLLPLLLGNRRSAGLPSRYGAPRILLCFLPRR